MSVAVLRAELEPEPLRAPVPDGRQRALAAALRGLRGAATVEQMLTLIPTELCRCNFQRAWISTVEANSFRPTGMHGASLRMTRRLDALAPASLRPGTHESEMLRRRHAILVEDAIGDEAVEPIITEVFAPRAYVAAPLLAETRVIAFVHADRSAFSDPIEAADRDLIAVFAEAASQALQRVILTQRLDRLRSQMRSLTGSVQDLVDSSCTEPITLSDPQQAQPEQTDGPVLKQPVLGLSSSRLSGLLTPRELEVLRLMAAGETNAGIARQLVISEGTVKSHVKNLLRKLHAANRAQAVSRYFRVARADAVS